MKYFVLKLGLAAVACVLPAVAQEGRAARENGRGRESPPPEAMNERVEKILKDQPIPRPGSRLKSLRIGDFIVEGPEHSLWALKVEGHAFAEWDGRTWQERPIPAEVAAINLVSADFVADHHGQAWILPFELDRTAVFDFASGKWLVFDSLREAVARKLVPGDTLNRAYNSVNLGPTSHVNGTKAFMHFDGRVQVMQKEQWHATTLAEIGLKQRGLMGTPFFNRDGFFSIPYGKDLYACLDGGQWQKIPWEEPSEVPLLRVVPKPPAEGWNVAGTEITSFCQDRTGAVWLTTTTYGLLKWRDGIWRQLRDLNTSLELRSGALFKEVILDAAGNAFLRYDRYDLVVNYEYVAAKPAGESPSATWEPGAGGNGSIQVKGLADGFLRWRLGEGKWSSLGQEAVLPLAGLLPGAYEVGLECFDAELSVNGPHFLVKFEIQGLTPDQIQEQIKGLQSAELSVREAAAAALKSQGATALNLLKEARVKMAADESLQWWLQAVIQHIEMRAGGK